MNRIYREARRHLATSAVHSVSHMLLIISHLEHIYLDKWLMLSKAVINYLLLEHKHQGSWSFPLTAALATRTLCVAVGGNDIRRMSYSS